MALTGLVLGTLVLGLAANRFLVNSSGDAAANLAENVAHGHGGLAVLCICLLGAFVAWGIWRGGTASWFSSAFGHAHDHAHEHEHFSHTSP